MELRNPLRALTAAERKARAAGSKRSNDPDPAEPDDREIAALSKPAYAVESSE